MSTPDLDAIQARLDAATPGPWRVEADHEIGGPNYAQVLSLGPVECMAYCYGGSSRIEGDNLDADAELIAHAPADLAALLAEVKRLTAERDEHERAKEVFRKVASKRRLERDQARAERDEARAALAALRGDVEALLGWPVGRSTNGVDRLIPSTDLAAVLANHPTTKEAE